MKKDSSQISFKEKTDELLYPIHTAWFMILILTLSAFTVGMTYSFFPLFLNRVYTFSLSDIGIFLSFVGFFSGLGAFLTGAIAKVVQRHYLIALSEIFYGLTWIFLLAVPPILVLLLLLFTREIFSSISSPLTQSITMSSVPTRKRGSWASAEAIILLFVEITGQMTGALLIERFGFVQVFMISGIGYIFAGVLALRLIQPLKNGNFPTR